MNTDVNGVRFTLSLRDIFERSDGGLWEVVAVNRGGRAEPVPYVDLKSFNKPPRRERIDVDSLAAMLDREEIRWVVRQRRPRPRLVRPLTGVVA